jgi:hypothetical protein
MRLFFYGTMRDPDVRRMVFGGRAEELIVRPALLFGFRTCSASGGQYPVLVRRTAARARGQLVEGLSYADLLRLFHFEGPDYLPSGQLAIDPSGRRSSAWVLLSAKTHQAGAHQAGAHQASAKTWRLRQWQLYRKPRTMPRLRIWMREFDRFEGNSVEITWPIRRQLKAWRESGDLAD